MDQGPVEGFLIDQARKNRQKVPQAIADAPVLAPGLQFYYDTFVTLSTDRSVGMGEGFIPWTAVEKFATRYSFSEDDLTLTWAILHAMDAEYLDYRNKKTNKDAKIGAKAAPDKPGEPKIVHTGMRAQR